MTRLWGDQRDNDDDDHDDDGDDDDDDCTTSRLRQRRRRRRRESTIEDFAGLSLWVALDASGGHLRVFVGPFWKFWGPCRNAPGGLLVPSGLFGL